MKDVLETLPPASRWRPSAASGIAIVAGMMLTTAMPPLRGTALLAPLALALLFHLLRDSDQPARHGFYFGLAYAVPLMSWLFFLDPAKSIPTRALVPVQAILAMAFVAAHYALLGLVAGRLRRRLGRERTLVLLPLLWAATELLRSVGELGFPWCLAGAAWLETPLRPLYATAGELGVGMATALSAAGLVGVADLARRGSRDRAQRWALVAAVMLLWLGLWLGSGPLSPSRESGRPAPSLRVACVQADVSQADKWDDAKIDSTRIPYTRLTRQAAAEGAELVVWAETAIPAYVRYERELLDWVRGLARQEAVAIVAGFPDARLVAGDETRTEGRRYLRFNAAGLFNTHGTLVDTYGKHHLVPVGEAMPFQRLIPILGDLDVGQAEWTHGEPPGPLALTTPAGEVPIFVLICYEAVFSDLARQAVRRGGTVLVNITNDGWFGRTAGPRQHAALARIRAVECGVPLVRCANNGISMICDADGVVLDRLDLDRRGLVQASIATAARETWYVRTGIWPALIYLGLWSLVGLWLARRGDGVESEEAA